MSLEDKLCQIYDDVEKKCRSDLRRHTRQIAKHVADVLRDGSWSDVTARADKALTEAATEAREHARLLDATGYLAEKVLGAENMNIVDLRLQNDLLKTQERILEMFANKEAPSRGFVYVAWSMKPEKFYYVGKAKTVARLNLAQHGKLAHATANATQLSLVFPSQSTEETLAGVEASLIALIEFHTNDLPQLNARRERVRFNQGADELRDLASFLESVANDLDPD